jgi:quercetin dioxygenase-like cupin family protein
MLNILRSTDVASAIHRRYGYVALNNLGGKIMETIKIHDHIAFSEAGPYRSVIYNSGDIKVQTVCLKAGQNIPPCTMEHDVLFYFLNGSGRITVDRETTSIASGTCLVVPKTAKSRSIAAESDMTILAVQAVKQR